MKLRILLITLVASLCGMPAPVTAQAIPDAGGNYTLLVKDATLVGTLFLQNDGRDIGNWWTDGDYVSWNLSVTNAGYLYELLLEASVAWNPFQAKVEITGPDGYTKTIAGELPQTGDWNTFATTGFGKVAFPVQGEYTLKVIKTGGQPASLTQVKLEATALTSIQPVDNQTVTLLPGDELLKKLTVETIYEGIPSFGGWIQPEKTALWYVNFPQAGYYDFKAVYSAVWGGARFNLHMGTQQQEITFAKTEGDWSNFTNAEWGMIYIPRAGDCFIEMIPVADNWQPMGVRQISFHYKPLINKGTDTAPILEGPWDEEAFAALNLDPAQLTSLDLTQVTAMTALPTLANLNPNCLIYISSSVTGSEGKNIVTFTDGVGHATLITLSEPTGNSYAPNPFHNTRPFRADKITYSRDFTSMTGWASICLPFAPDMNHLQNFTIKQYTGATVENEEITVTFSPADAIEANKPYIMKLGESTTGLFEANDADIEITTESNPSTYEGYAFKGSLNTIKPGDATSLYLLHSDGTGFGKGIESSYLTAFRAYFKPVNPGFSGSRLIIGHSHDGGATDNKAINQYNDMVITAVGNGILYIHTDNPHTVHIRTLDGRTLQTLSLLPGQNAIAGLLKGIYLINNRKVVVK